MTLPGSTSPAASCCVTLAVGESTEGGGEEGGRVKLVMSKHTSISAIEMDASTPWRNDGKYILQSD